MILGFSVPLSAMEYVEGETLAQLLVRLREADDDTETVFGKKGEQQFYLNLPKAFAGAAEGLQHAHSKSIVHRDIKPSNLILDPEGWPRAGAAATGGSLKLERNGGQPPRLRILDFGLAHLEGQESLTLSGDVLGTPSYMSPEQAKAKRVPIDHRSDVYSLGATLYEIVTLKPPFKGKDHQQTLTQIIERDPRPPRQLNPRTPAELETIVLKCLRKVPADRYGTAEALGQDLKRFVRGDPIEARPETRWERAAARLRLHRKTLLVATAFLALAASVAWFAHRSQQDVHLREQAELTAYEPAVLAVLKKIYTRRGR